MRYFLTKAYLTKHFDLLLADIPFQDCGIAQRKYCVKYNNSAFATRSILFAYCQTARKLKIKGNLEARLFVAWIFGCL